MTGAAATQSGEAAEASGRSRRHYVQIYTVIRVKVAVDAEDHLSAMKQADAVLFDKGFAVRLTPTDGWVLDAEDADEVTGYLVDEEDDESFARSRSYGADHKPL